MKTCRTVLESLRAHAESSVESIELVLPASDSDGWTDADEEDCEDAIGRLTLAFPTNVHVLRADELVQTNHVADMLDMVADTVYYATTHDGIVPIDARTVAEAIAEADDAEWRDGQPVSIREVGTGKTVAAVPDSRLR